MAKRFPKQLHEVGAPVRIDQGFGRVTDGIVESFGAYVHPRTDQKGFGYAIRLTGGTDAFGKPAQVGAVSYVNPKHVKAT